MPKLLQLSQLIRELKNLTEPVQENIYFFDPPDMSFASYEHLKQIGDRFLDIIASVFDSKENFFLNLMISFLPINAVLHLMEFALSFSDISPKNIFHLFQHERFNTYDCGYTQSSVEGFDDYVFYVACYEVKNLITYKQTV